MSDWSKTFDPLQCYEQLRSNILADPHYMSRGQYVLQHQGMCRWLTHIETLNSQWSADTTTIEPVLTTPSLRIAGEAGFHSQLNPLLADIILTIYRGGL
jgi:hypothetical protein